MKLKEELKKIGKEDAVGSMSKYWQAREEFMTKKDKISQNKLEKEYEHLKQALTPISDDELHMLLERLIGY